MTKTKRRKKQTFPTEEEIREFKEETLVQKEKTYLGEILDFCTDLGSRMIESGANIERVSLAIETVCRAYELTDVSLFLLNTHMSLGARDKNGVYASRQRTIPAVDIHLQRLKRLNRLSYQVASTPPPAGKLSAALEEAANCADRSDLIVLAAQAGAMMCLCFIFGGSVADAAAVALVTALMHWIMLVLSKPGLNRVVIIGVTMCAATAATVLLTDLGLGGSENVILTTVCMLVIPGIPLVNAARNLMSGNEMNGILQLLKVTVEVAALAAGIYAAQQMFGRGIESETVAAITDPIVLVLLSFAASVFFAVVFHVPPHDLVRAGMGGVISRIALLLLTPVIPYRVIYMALAALTASLYAEFLATRRRDPSTYFLYPSIIPLIPGDLFYYSVRGFITGDQAMLLTHGSACLLALAGMSVGFVVSSIIAHYVRRMRFRGMKKHA